MNNEILILNKLLRRLLRAWPIFLLAIIFWSLIGLMVTSLSPDFYKSKVSILIEEPYRLDDPQRWILGEQRFNEPERSYIVNEGIRLKSLGLVKKAIHQTGTSVVHFSRGVILDTELFDSKPFIVKIERGRSAARQLKDVNFNLDFDYEGKFRLVPDDDILRAGKKVEFDKKRHYHFGETIHIGNLKFSLHETQKELWQQHLTYGFRFLDVEDYALNLLEDVEIDAEQIDASIFTASLTLATQNKGKKILQALANSYVKLKLNERRAVLDSILKTINDELLLLSPELIAQENSIEKYKSSNKINSLEDQGRSLLEEITLLEGQLADIETHQEYLMYLTTSLEDNEHNKSLVSPSAYGLSDPVLNALNAEYNELIIQKEAYSVDNAEHPNISYINLQIKAKAQNISEIVKGFKSSFEIREKNLSRQLNGLKKRYADLPADQLELLRQERDFNSLDFNYRALNQRKAEVEIALASLAADVKIIEPAYNTSVDPFFPDPVILGILIILLSLITPFAYLFFQSLFSHGIKDPEDLAHLLNEGDFISTIHSVHSRQVNRYSRAFKEVKLICSKILEGGKDHKLITISHYQQANTAQMMADMMLSQFKSWGKSVLFLDLASNSGMIQGLKRYLQSSGAESLTNATYTKETISWAEADGILEDEDKKAIKALKEQYKIIVILLPDHYQNPDASVLQQLSDVSILTTKFGKTSISEFQELLDNSQGSKQRVSIIADSPFVKLPKGQFRKLWKIEKMNWWRLTGMMFKRI